MAKSVTRLRLFQIGHDDISTTFSIYTYIKKDNSMEEFKKHGLADTEIETE